MVGLCSRSTDRLASRARPGESRPDGTCRRPALGAPRARRRVTPTCEAQVHTSGLSAQAHNSELKIQGMTGDFPHPITSGLHVPVVQGLTYLVPLTGRCRGATASCLGGSGGSSAKDPGSEESQASDSSVGWEATAAYALNDDEEGIHITQLHAGSRPSHIPLHSTLSG